MSRTPDRGIDAAGEKPGDQIGQYRLLEKIGEGGCGLVYLAEQVEPVRRKAALKIVKAGMDTRSVIARFEAERQVLALMDHPSIAKVLDAGATEAGRPYFVMEFVRGAKITDYCNQHSLNPRARLELFVQVCRAIEHAHQKGIIHRDIKPSNILVTENPEGAPLPVVIDFGIAKATMNQRLTDKTLFTAFEMLIGTPAYMSPEQAALTGVEVDTRTDIYSLGVLLYELLTGAPPFNVGGLLQAGIDEVRRVIREQEPPSPSARLSTLSGEALTGIAQLRKVEAPALIRLVKGDLDWIAMRALEKDRTRRYETASGLAQDVQRHLTNEEILARPPSQLYRLRKFAARNRGTFAVAVTVATLLVVSLGIVSALLAAERRSLRAAASARQQAETDKAKAQAEGTRSEQVTRFLEEMLTSVQPATALGRDTTMVRDILDFAADRIRTDLPNQPASQAHFMIVMGSTYLQISADRQAESCFREAIALCRTGVVDDGRRLATALGELARVLGHQDKLKEAFSAANESLALRREIFGAESIKVTQALGRLASIQYQAGQYVESERTSRESLALCRRLFAAESAEVAEALTTLVIAQRMNQQTAEALKNAREALAIRLKILPSDHRVAQSWQLLGLLLIKNRSWSEAEAAFDQALRISRKVSGESSPDVATLQMGRGFALITQKRFPEAETVLREALAIARQNSSTPSSVLRETLRGLGESLQAQEKLSEAEGCLREAFRLLRETMPAGHPQLATHGEILAGLLVTQGKPAEAETLLNDLIPPDFAAKPQSAEFLAVRAAFYIRQGRWSDAETDATAAMKHRPAARTFQLLALAYAAQKKVEAYRELCREIHPFRGTKEVETAHTIFISCLLLPEAEPDFPALTPLVEFTARDEFALRSTRITTARALYAYRQGHYPAAITLAETALDLGGGGYNRIETYAVLAMAQFRLGQEEKARAALDQQIKYQQSPGHLSEMRANAWRERALAELLAREAITLLGQREQANITR